jgi:hypothetical protein
MREGKKKNGLVLPTHWLARGTVTLHPTSGSSLSEGEIEQPVRHKEAEAFPIFFLC